MTILLPLLMQSKRGERFTIISRKFLTYIFNSNTPEAVPSAVFLLSCGFVPLPLTVMQILAVDLGTDMLPALGLGVEPPEPNVMQEPPRKLSDRLLSKSLLVKAFLWYGLIESALAWVLSLSLIFYIMAIWQYLLVQVNFIVRLQP